MPSQGQQLHLIATGFSTNRGYLAFPARGLRYCVSTLLEDVTISRWLSVVKAASLNSGPAV